MFLAPYFIPKKLQLARLNNFKYARARVEERIKQGGIRGDFWDKISIKSAEDNAGGEGLTKEEMVVAAVTLVGTGSHTISTLLTGLAYFLGTNPHAMERLVDEIRSSFDSPDQINLVSVHNLKYLTACLNETMRLYPPVINMLWRTPPKGGGHAAGIFIPEGVSVAFPYTCMWSNVSDTKHSRQTGCNMSFPGIAQNPDYFTRPGDFCPERFLPNPPAEFLDDNHEAYHPFSLGAYNVSNSSYPLKSLSPFTVGLTSLLDIQCLGQNLANAESRLIMTKLLWHFDFELDENVDKDWLDQKSYGVFIKKDLNVRFTPGPNAAAKVTNGSVGGINGHAIRAAK
jgi:cytochrome P450